jgi:hypothetical protein
MSRLVEARLTLRIPRGGSGDLLEAVTRRLRRAAPVDRVDSLDVTGVRPGLNDLHVTVTTTVACADASATEPATSLAEAVCVEDAELLGTDLDADVGADAPSATDATNTAGDTSPPSAEDVDR